MRFSVLEAGSRGLAQSLSLSQLLVESSPRQPSRRLFLRFTSFARKRASSWASRAARAAVSWAWSLAVSSCASSSSGASCALSLR